MAHGEPVDHHVDRPAGRRGEVHLPVAVEVVETTVALAAGPLQVGGHRLALLGQAGEVDVLIPAQPRRVVGADDPDAEPAEQLEPDSRIGRAARDPQRVSQRVFGRSWYRPAGPARNGPALNSTALNSTALNGIFSGLTRC